MTADAVAPRRRYLTAASVERSSRCRAARMYWQMLVSSMATKRRKKNRAKSSMTTELAKVERALRSSSRESRETDQRTESSGARSAATMRGRPRAAASLPPDGRKSQTRMRLATPAIARTGPMRSRSSSTRRPPRRPGKERGKGQKAPCAFARLPVCPFAERASAGPQRAADAVLDDADDGRRGDADADDHGDERRHAHLLPPLRRVAEVAPALVARAEENALHRPEDVACGEEDADDGEDGRRLEAVDGADEDEELGDEAGHRRQAQRGEAGDDEDGGGDGHDVRQAGHVADLARVRAVVDQPHHDEEEGRYRAVREHLQRGAGEADLAEGGHPEQHLAHVADAGVGDEALEVALAHCEDGAVDDARRGEDRQVDVKLVELVGQDADEEADEHEGAARQRVEDELHRRVLFAPRAPDGDEEEHGHDLELPEEEEEDEVLRGEDAHHGRLQCQQPGEVLARAQRDLPGDEGGDDEE